MKKLVVTILGISVLTIGGSATVAGAPTATRPPQTPNPTLSAEVVDDIAVPLDVLLYVQTEYQGYAVTHANKVSRSGQQAYRLQVDRNDLASDGNSFYLFYDMSWKLLGEEKIAQPVQKTETKKSEQPDKPKEDQKKPDPENTPQSTQPQVEPTNNTEPTQPSTNTGDTTTQPTEPSTPTDNTTNDTQTGETTTTTGDGGSTTN